MARNPPALNVSARNSAIAFRAIDRYFNVVAVTAVLALAACGKGSNTAPPAPPGPPPGGGLPVTVLQVTPQRVPDIIEAVGQTEGSKDVEVRARVSGILEKTLYAEGDRIKAGTPLFQIDRAPFENALAQAKASLSQATASLAQERAKQEQAQREAGRLKQLVEQRAISQREYDDATTALKTEEALIAAADARVRDAEARVRDAELNLSYTNIAAPIGGISGRALRSSGSLVTAGNDSALLTTISQSDPIWVRFSVAESEYAQVRAAKKPEVRLVLADGSTFAGVGRLNFTASAVDAKLGTIQLRAEFGNAALALLPGQFVRVRLSAGESEAILVPQVAVVQNDQGRFVWVAGADGKAVLKPVEAANWMGRDWLIRKGLAAGDRVIVDNLLKLRPGAPVQPMAPAPAAPQSTPAKGAEDKSAPSATGKAN
jgi:membrane fusion protein, multidrug efflux system